MTIASQQGRQGYAGNGVTTEFPVPFKFFEDTDLLVIRQSALGIDSTLTPNVDYTLTGAGDELGGALTMGSAPGAGEALNIILDPARLQNTDYVSNDAFPAESHERALDRLTQQNIRTRDIVERTLRQPDGDFEQLDPLPGRSVRASKFLVFDADGNPSISVGTGGVDSALRTDLAVTTVGSDGAALIGYRGRSLRARLDYIPIAQDFGIVGNGADETVTIAAAIAACLAAGRKLRFPYTSAGYGVSDELDLAGKIEFEPGARFLCLAETLFTVDADLWAKDLFVDANNLPVEQCAITLKSGGTYTLIRPRVENIRGDGRSAYGIRVNAEGAGKTTRILGARFKQVTDARDGALSPAEEGFCGGILITGPTSANLTATGRNIEVLGTEGEEIFTAQADGTTENTSSFDADLIRVFFNDADATTQTFINSVQITLERQTGRNVQKRVVKASGFGSLTVRTSAGYGGRAGSQMSDIVFMADGRNGVCDDTRGIGKFDNVVKLDGTSFAGDYSVNDAQGDSSQAGKGCVVYAASLASLKLAGAKMAGDLERMLRFSDVDLAEATGVIHTGTVTTTNPLFDIQNCDAFKLRATCETTFSAASGQILYLQGSNRCEADLNAKATFATAGQVVRYNNVNDLRVRGHNETNGYHYFDEGANSVADLDMRCVHTGTGQAISITHTAYLALNASKLDGDWTGGAMTTGVVALSNFTDLKMTGIYEMLGLTDAGNDRGIVLTSGAGGEVNVRTKSGGSDAELIRCVSSSRIVVRSRSDGTKPGRILSSCSKMGLESFGPELFIDEAADTHVIANVDTW